MAAMTPIYTCPVEHYPNLQIQPIVSAWEQISIIYATTEVQMRAWPRTGRRQHLACCPMAEQISMKLAVEVGRVGAAVVG